MIVTMSEEEILKRLKEYIKPENMMFKLTALNCSILLLVTFILTATGNVIYQNSIADRSLANTVEIQNQVLRSLDLIFRSVSDNMEILGNNPAVQSYLTVDEERNPAQRVEKEGEVRDIFLEYSRTYQDYLNIVAVSEKGRYLSNDSYRLQKTPLSREQWYQDAIRADGALVLNTNVVGRNLKSWKNYSMENFISVSQMVKDRETGEPAGVLLVDLDIRTIRELIEEIDQRDLDLTKVADAIGCNPSYLSRVMKQELGISFKDFLTMLRIGEAIHLMRNQDLSLNQIAEKVGYSNQHYFSAAFKNCQGVSPSEYRRNLT